MGPEWLHTALGALAALGVAAIVKWLGGFQRRLGGQPTGKQAEAAVADVVARETDVQKDNAAARATANAEKQHKVEEVSEAVDSESPEAALAFILNERSED